MVAVDIPRPPNLYQYDKRAHLERSLTLGEFRLQPVAPAMAGHAPVAGHTLPFRAKPAMSLAGNYLTLRLTQLWDERLFDAAQGFDACLVIHDAEQFGERIHRAVQKALPNWAGIDAPVSYGAPSPLGAIFTQAQHSASQSEWLFAWRPIQPMQRAHGLVIQIGSIEAIAELRGKSN